MSAWRESFYLAGGTGLALQIGHRQSVDFDFFGPNDFNPLELFQSVKRVFAGRNAVLGGDMENGGNNHITSVLGQQAVNTLHATIDGNIELSFFKHPYILVKPKVKAEYFDIASMEDIACMKLLAAMDRHNFKDFVDLYAICQKISLGEIVEAVKNKYPTIAPSAFLYQLQYYEDVNEEALDFKNNFSVNLKQVEEFFKLEIRKLFNI